MSSFMPRVTLHIGLPKCASTSIQRYFAEHYWRNVRQGVLYPRMGRQRRGYRNHQPLFQDLSKLNTRLDRILIEARLVRAKRIFISNEDALCRMKNRMHFNSTQRILDRFGRENVDVIAITRAPAGLVRSSYAQFLKGGLWELNKKQFFGSYDGGIDDFQEFYKAIWGFELKDYENLLPHFAESFGIQSITEIPLVAEGGDVLARVAEELGLSLYGKLSRLNSSKTYCKSLFFRDFQKRFGPDHYRQNQRALNKITFPNCAIDDDEAVRLGLTLSKETAAQMDKGYAPRIVKHRF